MKNFNNGIIKIKNQYLNYKPIQLKKYNKTKFYQINYIKKI